MTTDESPTAAAVPNMHLSLDEIDRKLIEGLSENGRAGLRELGSLVGLSGDAVRERVRRLRTEGIVSVVGTPDPAALGYKTVALVGIRVTGQVIPVAMQLAEAAEIDFATGTFGSFDLLVEVLAEDDEHLLEVVDTRIRSIDGVRSCEVFLYLDIVKWTPGGLAPAQMLDASTVRSVDETDRAIIIALQRDGRASFQDLADATGLSYPNARRRAKALMESGAVQIITTVNRLVEGTAVMAAVGLRGSAPAEQVASQIRHFPEIEVAVQSAGSFDLLLEVACRDRAHLKEFVSQLRGVDGVAATETFVYAHLFKLPVQWSAAAMSGTVA